MALDLYLAEEVALDCADGLLSRREAVRRLMLLGLSAPAVAALLAACGSDGDGDTSPSTSGSPPTVSETSGPSTTVATPGSSSAPASTTAAGAAPTGVKITFPGPRSELIGLLAEATRSAN